MYHIIFSLVPHPQFNWQPVAFVAESADDGRPGFAKGKVFGNTFESYGILSTPQLKRLFVIIDELSDEKVILKHTPKGKKGKPLVKMWEEEAVKATISGYVERLLDEYLKLVRNNQLLFALEVQRKLYVSEFLLKTNRPTPRPDLFFQKTNTGVNYRLRLAYADGKVHKVSQLGVEVLVNNPAWIATRGSLYQLPDINGNMLKPFIAKDEVPIVQRFVRDYFKKFILKVASKADIEAEGFQIEEYDQFNKAQLAVNEDFLRGDLGLSLAFVYGNESFPLQERTQRRTRLRYGEGDSAENDQIAIVKYIRDAAKENAFLQKLESLGFQRREGLFVLANKQEDKMALMAWLQSNIDQLREAGFEIDTPSIQGKLVNLGLPSIKLKMEQAGDWLDINGYVQFGEFTFPFHHLGHHIRTGNRFFPLPDGTCFLIPFEWFAQYESIFRWGKTNGENLRFAKSQLPLLDSLRDHVLFPEDNAEALLLAQSYLPSEQLKADLRPYQLEGVRWLVSLHERQLGGCLADDMGLGKTLQTIALLLYAKEKQIKLLAESTPESEPQVVEVTDVRRKPVAKKKVATEAPSLFDDLPIQEQEDWFQTAGTVKVLSVVEKKGPAGSIILLPASLIFNWRQELKKFAPSLSVYSHVGTNRLKFASQLKGFDIILTTYQTALRDAEMLSKLNFTCLILDESQQIKNKESKLFSAVNSLRAEQRLSLSGTPVENSLSDLWAQMQFINPELLGSYRFFKDEFQVPIEKQRDEEKLAELRQMVRPYLLRRTKEAVAPDLPPLTKQVYYCEMDEEQRKLYEKEKSAARNYLLQHYTPGDSKSTMNIIEALLRLRQIANHPRLFEQDSLLASGKQDDVLNHLNTIRASGHKALIFSQFVKHLELYREPLDKDGTPYCWLTGETSQKDREAAVKRFEEDPYVPFFLISLKAGGTGLNLTSAGYVVVLDPWWNPAVENQAIARAHRIGQTQAVIATKFITKDSIEEKILLLQERKQQLADDIIIGADGKLPLEKEELAFLVS